MAGGRGERLRPLTDKTPKPLLSVGRKPLIEELMDEFDKQGFGKFTLCLGYKADLIQKHFETGFHRWDIDYVVEKNPLGTGGPLNLLPEFDEPFIVCNSDIRAYIDYTSLMSRHNTSDALMTVCTALYQHQIPYGVMDSTGLDLVLREKPIENFAVNAGVYVLDPRARKYAPDGRFDMTDLVTALAEDRKVATYPLQGYWEDVGHFEDRARLRDDWDERP